MSAPLPSPCELPADLSRHEPVRWCVLAAAVVFCALVGPMAAGWLYVCDDLGAFHLPVRAFYAEQLARGEPFDWMPNLFAGFYLTGEGQAGTYHPWHWLLYRCLNVQTAMAVELAATYPLMFAGMWLLLRRWVGRPEAAAAGSLIFTFSSFNLLHFLHPNAVAVVAHLPWLLWAIHVMFTSTRRLQTALAQAAVALLTASQILLGYPQYVWFSLLAEAGFAAWFLATKQRTPRLRAGLPVAEQRTAGRQGSMPAAEQSPAEQGPAEPRAGLPSAGYSPRGQALDSCLRLAAAKLAGLLAGGVQLLATCDAWSQAARRAADSDFTSWGSLHPVNLVQLVAPYLFAHRSLDANTHEMSTYLGVVPLVLIVWVACRRKHLGRLSNVALAAALLAAFGLLMALGRYGPLYWCQRWLPVAGRFRFPCRYLVLFQLGASVLAALGFALLVEQYRRARRGGAVRRMVQGRAASRAERRRSVATSRARGAALAALGIRQGGTSRGSTSFQPRPPGIGPRIGAIIRLQALRKKIAPWVAGYEKLWMLSKLSLAVAVAGIVLQGHPRIAGLSGVLAGPVLVTAAAVAVVLASKGSRLALAGLVVLAAADLGAYGLSYLAPGVARPERYLQAVRANSPPGMPEGRVLACLLPYNAPGLRVGNAMTLLGWQRADGYAGLEPYRRLDYHQPAALRAAGVQWVRRGPSTAEIEGLLPVDSRWWRVPRPLPYVRLVSRVRAGRDPARQIRQIDLETTALAETPLALPPGEPGRATLIERRPGRLVVETECNTRQLLVVAESWHPGWKAAVDNAPQPVLRVNGDFLGCVVEAGRQRVLLQFQPRSLWLGRVVSAAGLALAGLCVLATWMGEQPAKGPARQSCATARPERQKVQDL